MPGPNLQRMRAMSLLSSIESEEEEVNPFMIFPAKVIKTLNFCNFAKFPAKFAFLIKFPFIFFSFKVWDIILDNIEDYRDVLGLFDAYPGLERAFQWKKSLWLFNEVLPLIASKRRGKKLLLSPADLLNCRLICRQWTQYVDSYLNNPSTLDRSTGASTSRTRRYYGYGSGYGCGSSFVRSFSSSGAGVACGSGPDISSRSRTHPHNRSSYFRHTTFKTEPQLTTFLRQTERLPASRNPFRKRSMKIVITHEEENFQFWSGVYEVLRKFGWHLWFMQIHYLSGGSEDERERAFNFFRMLTGVFFHLPNLRGLELVGLQQKGYGTYHLTKLRDPVEVEHLLEIWEGSPSHLPQLNNLIVNFPGMPKKLARLLVSWYGGQLHKLELQIKFMPPQGSSSGSNLFFCCLSELTLLNINMKEEADKLLQVLQAPQLTKLRLDFTATCPHWEPVPPIRLPIEQIFFWLKRFPILVHFDIGAEPGRQLELWEEGLLNPNKHGLPYLQFLGLRDSIYLTYNFLLCLPKLQQLQLYLK